MSSMTPPAPEPVNDRRPGRFASEMMAGGSVVEKDDDELVGGWRGALGVLAVVGLFALLAFANVWWFVFAIGILVAIFLHELGHYLTARWTGMKSTQFFIGFGPRVWSFRRGETEYGLRLIPLGAFVRIVGMNSMDEVPPEDEARTYRSKSYPRRLLVISAGSITHIVAAVLLLFVVYAADGEMGLRPGAEVVAPASDAAADATVTGPARAAGIQPGDVIVAVGGVPVDSSVGLGKAVRAHLPGDTVVVSVVRNGEPLDVTATLAAREAGAGVPTELVGTPILGVQTGGYYETVEHGVGAAATNAVTDVFPVAWESTKGVVKALNPVNVFTHLVGTNDDITTRPTTLVGVTGVSDDIGRDQGLFGVLFLLAVLNVFVGVFNMFPLLPLDGGHAAIATYERIREFGSQAGERYHADVAKAMPLAMMVITLLGFLFLSGLYLDITDPL
jgi:membrane-associated protease RseP (regulator of RpoE activity)